MNRQTINETWAQAQVGSAQPTHLFCKNLSRHCEENCIAGSRFYEIRQAIRLGQHGFIKHLPNLEQKRMNGSVAFVLEVLCAHREYWMVFKRSSNMTESFTALD
jgi:hypothetical protein